MAGKTQYAPCKECGEEFIKWPRNRTTCAPCQAKRDLDYRPGMKRTCEYCERTFYPFRTSHKACADCSIFGLENDEKYPACQECGKHKRTAPGAEKNCISCVQSSKEMQSKYHRWLNKRWGRIVAAREGR